jgi:hypothetical protein
MSSNGSTNQHNAIIHDGEIMDSDNSLQLKQFSGIKGLGRIDQDVSLLSSNMNVTDRRGFVK